MKQRTHHNKKKGGIEDGKTTGGKGEGNRGERKDQVWKEEGSQGRRTEPEKEQRQGREGGET